MFILLTFLFLFVPKNIVSAFRSSRKPIGVCFASFHLDAPFLSILIYDDPAAPVWGLASICGDDGVEKWCIEGVDHRGFFDGPFL